MNNKEDEIIKRDASYHLVGIGGIGMSGLAQLLVSLGCRVSGSDRGMALPENKRIFDALKAQGIKLYEQNGSYIQDGKPDALIYSTAIENENPDFACVPDIKRIHRSEALSGAMMLSEQRMIAVTGTCGKTTVTSWLAEVLHNSGFSPSFISGGLVKSFCSPVYAGNFYPGKGEFMVFEADESDKSLLAYSPDYAVILNIGTDHYPKEELAAVFREFLKKVKKGVVVEDSVYEALGKDAFSGLELRIFSANTGFRSSVEKVDWRLSGYHAGRAGVIASINDKYELKLPAPGIHTAANALAILALLDLIAFDMVKALEAVSRFNGVWRRFDFAGTMSNGLRIYDDYAHNVEKICSCVSAAREIAYGRIFAVFQPHGYGPLGFMKDELLPALEKNMRENDVFALLPVYYAGGTSSFKPSSEDVISEFALKGKKEYLYFPDRASAVEYIRKNAGADDLLLIMGARDNSLSDWAKSIKI
ncbi:MAG: hypothetical protein A2017_19805 [Lentisphaerae bacterium GWF2_44_16]|nr:MAG: hypothetical protein A2017_19805 [Lentisphaerae bacterium GWF2_44_16]